MLHAVLRAHRKQKHLTQQEAADRAGLTQTTLCRFESGQQEPRLDQLRRLAHLYRVKDWELLKQAQGEGL